MKYSIGRPAPGHDAHVGRVYLGTSSARGRLYGTVLHCSCGFHEKVSNEAPSRGGKTFAQDAYSTHLKKVQDEQQA